MFRNLSICTGEFPWIELVEIDLGYDGDGERGCDGLLLEVVNDELFVGGVESETGRQLRLVV